MSKAMALAQPRTASPPDEPVIAGSVKIDRGVPIPTRAANPRGRSYSATGKALRALAVEDSFIWPRKKGEGVEATRNRAQAAFTLLKPRKFSTRIVENNGVRALRVWRVA